MPWTPDPQALAGRVALVAGATRGAGRGIAVALGEAGATVVCTGRSSTSGRLRSDYDRPETIEETAALVDAAGGTGVAMAVDHLDPAQVGALAATLRDRYGHLDVLVNDIWGAEVLKGGPADWNTPIWEHDLDTGLRILRLAIDTHLITSHHLLPLLVDRPGGLVVEVTDGTLEYNARNYRISVYYDLAKVAVNRLAFSQGHELAPHGATAVAITPGWLRSELMLDVFAVDEEHWRDALDESRGERGLPVAPPDFALSETPRYIGRAVAAMAADDGPGPVEPAVGHRRATGPGLRVHRRRRLTAGRLGGDRLARQGLRSPSDGGPAVTYDATIGALDGIVDGCAADGDRTGYFAAMYLAVTNTVRRRAGEGEFADPAAMERFVTGFADRYLDAVTAWRAGKPCSKSWVVAFQAAPRWRPIILQHLLLGINAHINLDLGVAACDVAAGRPLEAVRADFDAVNDVLRQLIDGCQGALDEVSPWLDLADKVGGPGDETLIRFSLVAARRQAWSVAQRLSVLTGSVRDRAIASVDGETALLGRLVEHPGFVASAMLLPIRVRERAQPREVMQLLRAVRPATP